MKKITLALLTCTILSACGQGQFDTLQEKDNSLQIQIDNLNGRVSLLEQLFSKLQTNLIVNVNSLQQAIDGLADLNAGQQQALQQQIDTQQAQLNSVQATITELTLRTSVVEVIDPCGDGPGYDEVLIRLSDGNIVAYFESGSNRFLSLLQPGSYRTTDATNCNFTVDNNKKVCYASTCK